VADDPSREAVAGIARTGRCRHPARLPGSAASRKPAGSQVDGAPAAIMGMLKQQVLNSAIGRFKLMCARYLNQLARLGEAREVRFLSDG